MPERASPARCRPEERMRTASGAEAVLHARLRVGALVNAAVLGVHAGLSPRLHSKALLALGLLALAAHAPGLHRRPGPAAMLQRRLRLASALLVLLLGAMLLQLGMWLAGGAAGALLPPAALLLGRLAGRGESAPVRVAVWRPLPASLLSLAGGALVSTAVAVGREAVFLAVLFLLTAWLAAVLTALRRPPV